MAHFKLIEKKRNRLNATFHVIDEEQSICGSINVKLEDADNLLRCWNGAKTNSPQSKQQQQQQNPVQALAAAFLKNRLPVSKASLLRGCNG